MKTGWFGLRSRFVTVEGSRPRGSDVVIAVDRDMVKNAPIAGRPGPLSATEDAALTAYYASRLPPRALQVGDRQ